MVNKRRNRFPKLKKLTVSQQFFQLKSCFPNSDGFFKRNEFLHWIGSVHPTPCSPVYKVQVDYRFGKYPRVNILSPKLEKEDKKKLPHVYSKDELCLFMPKYKEWNATMAIARTILPWTSLWLFNYEAWRATGEWLGGGTHPENSGDQSKSDLFFSSAESHC